MTNEKLSGETLGAKALMFAMIAGAALLFVEATWSPSFQPSQTHPVATQTAVAHHDNRLASN